ncbi:Ctr copper transporter [Dendryphion nanum]|uniref:Copper transport protein n=1 Tax=Dendryphion nanum TaxID=256645 RepID=A0A9P9DCF1_9PLEO|nr:Ctr copper transporter [Dendryphion nanum]
MSDMPGMATTFSVNTRVTLWFTEWTTTTRGTYFLTILFLFSLGIFNRFLGAFKSQLERKWKEQGLPPQSLRKKETGEEQSTTGTIRGHVRQWSRAMRPQPVRLDDPERELESEPLSPAPPNIRVENEEAEKPITNTPSKKKLWISSAPWSIKEDGIRATLEFIRALIGYILMLAVMTYNVGFLFAVTGSVLLGEFIFGRYTQGSRGWQEGGCHE